MATPILFLHYGEAWLRGSEICLLELLRRIDRDRFRPIAISHSEPLRAALAAEGIEAHALRFPEFMIDAGHVRLEPLRAVRALARIGKILDGRRPALVYCNSGLAAQLGSAVAFRLRAPRIVHLHAPFYRRMYWFWRLSSADLLIFVSEATQRKSLARIARPPPSLVIPNGIDLTRFAPAPERDPSLREQFGIPAGAFVIGQIGSLIRRKGVDVLLEAFARLRRAPGAAADMRLLLVGDGPARAAFETQARALGIASFVVFAGEQPAPERLWQHAIDVNVLAARLEALPLSLLEASACGVPSVCSDVGGNPEAIADGETGRVVPVENPDALARALASLRDDPALRARLGRAARERAQTRFGLDRQVRAVEACLATHARAV